MKAVISLLDKRGTHIRQVWCEDDGNLTRVGRMLRKYYNTWDEVNTLISYGAIITLGENLLLSTFEHRDQGKEHNVGRIRIQDWQAKSPVDRVKFYRFVNQWYIFEPNCSIWIPLDGMKGRQLSLFPQDEIKL
jgi:hypothetical protein